MPSISWQGGAPPEPFVRALREAGFPVGRDGCLTVVASRRFDPPSRGPWVWLPEEAPTLEQAGEAVCAGAVDVFGRDAPRAAERLVRRARDALVPEPRPVLSPTFVGESEAVRRLLSQVANAAATAMPVLFTGETGTGKEVCARVLHGASARAERVFEPINCAAIPNELMEAEIFGYARGAFSGAVSSYDGKLAAAEGGTVFLDEVDDTPLSTQVKLLRVLEDRQVTRLGENSRRQVDFRLIAATNRELEPLVDSGAFLPDLYQRLAIVAIRVPPLRERIEDLPALCEHFIERFYADEPAVARRARIRTVTPEALAALAAYPWPGNTRELRNAIFQSLVEKRAGDELLLSDLPRRLLGKAPALSGEKPLVDATALAARLDSGRFDLVTEIEALERTALRAALARAGGNASRAAALLGRVGRGGAQRPDGTVRAMQRRLGLDPKPPRGRPSRAANR